MMMRMREILTRSSIEEVGGYLLLAEEEEDHLLGEAEDPVLAG